MRGTKGLLLVVVLGCLAAQPAPAAAPPQVECGRVGQIFIAGNVLTPQIVILRELPLYPGQIVTCSDLRQAEKNLARLNIRGTNGERTHPTVTQVIDPIDPDNPVKDILVTVQETRTGSLMFGVGVNSDAGATGSIVLNERNFDILRPKSIDDVLDGNAWRGAGQELRIESVPGTLLPGSFRMPK